MDPNCQSVSRSSLLYGQSVRGYQPYWCFAAATALTHFEPAAHWLMLPPEGLTAGPFTIVPASARLHRKQGAAGDSDFAIQVFRENDVPSCVIVARKVADLSRVFTVLWHASSLSWVA